MNRRAVIFLVFAATCVALVPIADQKHRWVAEALAGVYVVLAFLSWLDARNR